MHVLIYASPLNLVSRNLHKKIQSMKAGIQSTCLGSLKALDDHLRQPLASSPIGILMPSSSSELAALIGLRHLFGDMRIILILPEQDYSNCTNSNAHMLRPRFIGCADGDLSDVTAVLGKMIATSPAKTIHAVH